MSTSDKPGPDRRPVSYELKLIQRAFLASADMAARIGKPAGPLVDHLLTLADYVRMLVEDRDYRPIPDPVKKRRKSAKPKAA